MASNNKYDRQLRLWGNEGQKALSTSCIILLRCSAVGTETLKNLILPGIGRYIIMDDNNMYDNNNSSKDSNMMDVERSNFFWVGNNNNNIESNTNNNKCRAQISCELLQELNPDVIGTWENITTSSLISYDYITLFDNILTNMKNIYNENITKIIVIGCDLEPLLINKISVVCDNYGSPIPFIIMFSYGFLGIVKIQLSKTSCILPIMNTKPRDMTPDLRLYQPFHELQMILHNDIISNWEQRNNENDESVYMENMKHGQIPYPCILYHVMNEWKKLNNNTDKMPSTFEEKQQFQSMIRSSSRHYDNELNFQEAVRMSYLIYTPTKVIDNDHIQSLIDELVLANQNNMKHGNQYKFYCMLIALQQFLCNHKQIPPLHGTIPDMTSSTDWYIQLQNIYQTKAIQDRTELKSYYNNNSTKDSIHSITITDDEWNIFCQNVYNLDILYTNTFNEQYDYTKIANDDICDDLISTLMEDDDDDDENARIDQIPLLWYIGFCACQLFYIKCKHYPGEVIINDNSNNDTTVASSSSYKDDIIPLQTLFHTVLNKYKLTNNERIQKLLLTSTVVDQDNDNNIKYNPYAMELVRYGNCEIHTIGSIIGGVASQEIVKIITEQYIPMNNTYVYNGIASIGSVYRF